MRLIATPLLLALAFAVPQAALAEHNPAESNWVRVQALAPNTAITVKSAGHKTHCRFIAATADAFTCGSGSKPPQSFDRTAVTLVQQDHRSKSTLLGLGIGTAGGAVFGAAIGRNGSFVPRGAAAAGFGAVGAVFGTIIGAAGNFAHTTIYRAP